jgi:hypothetical protein
LCQIYTNLLIKHFQNYLKKTHTQKQTKKEALVPALSLNKLELCYTPDNDDLTTTATIGDTG